MRSLLLVIAFFLAVSFFGQSNNELTIKFNAPKYPVDYTITNPVINTVAKVKVTYTGDEYMKVYDYTPLYLNKLTKDFTIVDDKVVVSFLAAEQSFFLNQIHENGKALLPENSSIKTSRESQNEENIFLSWKIGANELTVTFWVKNLEEVLADD